MSKKLGKALKAFFRDKEHLVCRFCTTAIADLEGQALYANDQYTRILATLTSGQQYRFNGCKSCMEAATLEMVQAAFSNDPGVPNQLKKSKIASFELIVTPPKSEVAGALRG